MRFVILVSAIVLLVIAADINAQQFGDIIFYNATFKNFCPKFKYRHVAIYVGDHPFPSMSKNPGQTIFERLKEGSQCVFSKPDMKMNPVICNYLDGYVTKKGVPLRVGTEEEMKKRITELHKKCGLYNGIQNNCEHLATYVRYGVKIALQDGLSGEGVCISRRGITRKHALDFVKTQRDSGALACNVSLVA